MGGDREQGCDRHAKIVFSKMEAILGTVCPLRCATSALVLPNPLFLTRAAGQKDHDMTHHGQLYIDGTWVAPSTREVVDPTTGAVFA